MQDAVLLVVGATLLAWVVRISYLGVRTNFLVRKLPAQTWSDLLAAAVDRTAVSRVVCIESDRDLAFCAGLLRPRVFISWSLVDRLQPPELDAILLHERQHCQRRDPLRYAALAGLRDVCFYLPILTWLARYHRENAELRADRAAILGVGRRPLAGALLALDASDGPAPLAAFVGSAELRTAQILGDSLPRRRPDGVAWLASVVGTSSLFAIAGCAAQLAFLH
jgi:beta-lactamase regulating signal transducer with metallopeptidase domain